MLNSCIGKERAVGVRDVFSLSRMWPFYVSAVVCSGIAWCGIAFTRNAAYMPTGTLVLLSCQLGAGWGAGLSCLYHFRVWRSSELHSARRWLLVCIALCFLIAWSVFWQETFTEQQARAKQLREVVEIGKGQIALSNATISSPGSAEESFSLTVTERQQLRKMLASSRPYMPSHVGFGPYYRIELQTSHGRLILHTRWIEGATGDSALLSAPDYPRHCYGRTPRLSHFITQAVRRRMMALPKSSSGTDLKQK